MVDLQKLDSVFVHFERKFKATLQLDANSKESARACVVNDLLAKSGVAAPFELSLRIGPPLTVPAYSSWSPSLNRVGLRLEPAPRKGARMDDCPHGDHAELKKVRLQLSLR